MTGTDSKNKSLTLLVVILHDLDVFTDLLETWKQIGVPGVTILQSMGGFQAQDLLNRTGLSNLFGLFDQGKTSQRTLLALFDDQQILDQAIAEADRIVRGFDRPHSGILFTLPVGIVLGLQKWGSQSQQTSQENVPEKTTASPLLKWFEEDMKARGESETLREWQQRRSVKVGDIIQQLKLQPTVVRTDDDIQQVIYQMLVNPSIDQACVVNAENRLVGTIVQYQLGEAMLVNIVPEEFLGNPEGYAKAMDVANGKRPQIAADVMQTPVFIMPTDTLDVAYQRMHKAHLIGLPVVDEKYHLLGYLSVLELLSICYPEKETNPEK